MKKKRPNRFEIFQRKGCLLIETPDDVSWKDSAPLTEISGSEPLVAHPSGYFFDPTHHLDQNDEKNISALIRKLADSSYARLFRKRKELERLTDQIYHIHPLYVIKYIYITPPLKSRMPKILDDSLGYKRIGFLNGYKQREGLIQKMNEQMDAQNLLQLLPEFAQSLNISENAILPFFYARDWEGLLRYLLKN